MAKVHDNPITEGLSGKLGRRLQFRRGRGGKTIVALSPVYSDTRVLSEAQLAHHEAFGLATQYAVEAKDNPIYVQLARGADATAYNLAIADWFRKPAVQEIDASAWTGEIGQTIRIVAKDDAYVASVHVAITDAQGTVLEEGEAVRAEKFWWTYTTTSQVPQLPNRRIVAVARDLPGNSDSLTQTI